MTSSHDGLYDPRQYESKYCTTYWEARLHYSDHILLVNRISIAVQSWPISSTLGGTKMRVRCVLC